MTDATGAEIVGSVRLNASFAFLIRFPAATDQALLSVITAIPVVLQAEI